MLESSVEKTVVDYAEKRGWLVRKLRWIGRVGAPDRIFIRDGRVVFIEFKKPRKKAIGLQGKEGRRIIDHGGEWHQIDNVGDGCELLR